MKKFLISILIFSIFLNLIHLHNFSFASDIITVEIPATDSVSFGDLGTSSSKLNIGAYGSDEPRNKILIKFNNLFDYIPEDSEIISAKLRLYQTARSNPSGVKSINLYRVKSYWSSSKNYKSADISSYIYDSEDWDDDEGISEYHYWDMSELVQNWVDGSYNNYGLQLIEPIGYGFLRFAGHKYDGNSNKKPKLIVQYRKPFNNPPIISIISPIKNNFMNYEIPIIKYNVYDYDDDIITGYIEMYNNGSWHILDTATLSSGDNQDYSLNTSTWDNIPFNTNVLFRIRISDGENVVSENITIVKVNNAPSVIWLSPAINSSFKTNQPPNINIKVADIDNDLLTAYLQYYNGSSWVNVATKSNLANNTTTSFKIPSATWESYDFNTNLRYRVRITDGLFNNYTSEVILKKTNTAPIVNIIKPVNDEKMFAGYLPFTWSISDIDSDNISLKIYTDTSGLVNNGILFNGNLGKPYSTNNLFRTYFPVGIHKIYFEFKDGYNTVTQVRTIDIQDLANIHIDDKDTVYIPIFSKEKSDVYYKKLNAELTDSLFMFNILQSSVNQGYVSNINNIQNVTNDTNYTNNGDRIYNTNGLFDVSKIADWIYSRVSTPTNPIIKVIETGMTATLKNIIFSDDERDYTSTNPVNRGQNRQFKFEHYPQIYENADSEIVNNGIWIDDSVFTYFDEKIIKRDGEDIKIEVSKSGKYLISLKEKDSIKNTANVDFSKESDIKQIELYAHRRPSANIYYTDNGDNTINLISKSYDLDFETRIDKGIAKEFWFYRIVDYDGKIISDYKPILDITKFAPSTNYKTDIKLQVQDYGARLDLTNDGELTDTDIITIDATGKPPIANFEFKVGTTLQNSVMADGEVYKGNIGKETLQLDPSYTIWNDFFGKAARLITWSKSQTQLNSEIQSSNSLSTTLNIRNKYSLTDSITKSLEVKDVIINNNSNLVKSNRYFNLDINLSSSKHINKWGNFKVVVTSSDLSISSFELVNTFSNRFTNNILVTDDGDGILDFTVTVYSNRTKEALSKENYSLVLNRPPTIKIKEISPKYIYEGDNVNALIVVDDPDLETLKVEFSLYKESNIIKTWNKIVSPNGLSYNDIIESIKDNIQLQTYNVTTNYRLYVKVVDNFGEYDVDDIEFKVYPLNITGSVKHTIEWEKNRKNYNLSITGTENTPRTPDVFFPGEKFILEATTTEIDPLSNVVVDKVTTSILSTPYITELLSSDDTICHGSLWDENMLSWDDKTLTFRFIVYYSNGTIKTHNVNINIIDDDYWRLHRKF